MTQRILVSVAWPYASSDIHVGNITGAYLPADIFARYHRLRGNRVLMVSGSDSHGTPITVRADEEGRTPQEVYETFHARFLELFVNLGLAYDLFTTTHTENHFRVSQTMFTRLLESGYLYTETQQQWFSAQEDRFLPDRYVEGTCYICGFEQARGDQCDNCGNLLDASQLINPHSKTASAGLELRETEHYFLDLGKLTPELTAFLTTDKEHWRPNVLKPSLHLVTAEGLHGRAITRDLDWGIPVPLDGWEGKCLYVWFEAVIGYLSASIEWATLQGTPEAWQDWWYNADARTYYFIGKDNIPFHAVIWPAELAGARYLNPGDGGEQFNLPYDVPANEFMNLEGRKISGSRNWAVWGNAVVERYGADPIRFYLTAAMPETRDSDWVWAEFVQRNNDDLVATWGNLANRVLTFAYKHFDRQVPEPGELQTADRDLLDTVERGFESVGNLIDSVKLRAALQEALRLAGEVNKYLDQQAPWFAIKTNREQAARAVYTALRAIDSLKILFAPFVPFSSERLHAYLGYDGALFGQQAVETFHEATHAHSALVYRGEEATGRWTPSELAAGQPLRQPAPLFRKLDDSVVAEETARLG
ncbi:MAG: methionine--tRNA ligase [Anaerolineales bacterium]